MGGGQIFLKNRRASFFNDDLSIELNFGRIHLAHLPHNYKKTGKGTCHQSKE